MIPSLAKMQFDVLLLKQHLADVRDTFSDPDFFDEVPLYSRYSQVEFLKQYGDLDFLLIELALDYLDRVTFEATLKNGAKRFLAIMAIVDGDEENIVPSIFVCNGNVKSRLKNLQLSPPSEGFGKRIEALVRKAKLDSTFGVFEDRATIPDEVRVFISYKSPPEGLVSQETIATGSPASAR